MPIEHTTKWYSSAMGGAPGLTNAAGQLIALLDACLINGFGSVTLDSLVVVGNVATLTKSTGHGLLDQQIIEIAGATPSALNGQWRFTRTGANTGTFSTSGISDQTATGTITAKTPSLGWAKPYSGTNKAAYQGNTITGSGSLLRIDDTATSMPRAVGYLAMSDVDTGTEIFPTNTQASGGSYFPKSNSATSRAWYLVGSDTGFYLSVQVDGSSWCTVFFGDTISFYAGDVYRALLHGCQATGSMGYMGYVYGSSFDLAWMPRNHLFQVGPIRCCKRGISNYSGYYSGAPQANYAYLSPLSGGLIAFSPILVEQYNSELRSKMPGYVQLVNNCGATIAAGSIITGAMGFPDPFIVLRDNYGGVQTAFGVSLGAWT